MSKPIYYKGQEVGCLIHGEGIVVRLLNDGWPHCMFEVQFGQAKRTYNKDGSLLALPITPILYPIDQYREIIANLPAPQPEPWKPKPGDWCWFWDTRYKYSVLSTLESYHADKHFPYLTGTGTSYKNCAPFVGELPPHLKEVQP